MEHFLPSVTVDEFTSIVKRQFEHGLTRPIFGLGKGGIGKSESISDLAKSDLKIGYKDVRLLLYSESDLKGIPYINKEHTHTIWLHNDILPREDRDGNRGILVLDEITSCSKSVRTAAYQLLNERCLGEYVLPEGWMIVCLGNGEDDGGQFNGMEGNFANRCSVFQVVAHLESWKTWAYAKKIHPLVLSYLTFRPTHLHTYDPEQEEQFLFASPRGWTGVSEVLDTFGFDQNDSLTSAQIHGILGKEVGSYFLGFCRMQEFNNHVDAILKGEEVPPISSREVLLMTIQGVVSQLKEELDTCEDNFSSPFLSDDPCIDHLKNALRWIFSLGKLEYEMMAVKDLIACNRQRVSQIFHHQEFSCPELMTFIGTHKDLLTP